MGVGTEDHATAGGQLLTDILVNNRLVGRNIDTAILLGGGESEHMVVLVDRTAHSAQRVVAVGHGVRDRELLQAAGTGRLDDTDIGDVMGSHCVEMDTHLGSLSAFGVMRAENRVGYRVLTSLVFAGHPFGILDNLLSVKEVNSVWNQFYHNSVVLRILIS